MEEDRRRLQTGLNRTSVGLKLVRQMIFLPSLPAPQSNQRGIETSTGRTRPARAAIRPQSNQRGIETRAGSPGPGLAGKPQSNQRGIETAVPKQPQEMLQGASIEPAWD